MGPFFSLCDLVGAGLGEALEIQVDRLFLGGDVALGGLEGTLVGGGLGYGCVKLLLGDDVLGDQRGVALDVEGRLLRLGCGRGDLGLVHLDLGLRLFDLGLAAEHVGAGGLDGGAGLDAGDGDVDDGLLVLGLGVGEVGLGLLERDLRVLGVDLGDGIARVDELLLLDVDMDDLAGDTGADLVEVAVHLGVVGVFGEGGAPVEECGANDDHSDDDDDDELAPWNYPWAELPASPVVAHLRSGRPRLLSSEILFVVRRRHTQRTCQRELGDVVLVERADVLVFGLAIG